MQVVPVSHLEAEKLFSELFVLTEMHKRMEPHVGCDYWVNSTPTRGIRSIRIRLFSGMHNWVVEPTNNQIGQQWLNEMQALITAKGFKDSVQFYWFRGVPNIRILYFSSKARVQNQYRYWQLNTLGYKQWFINYVINFNKVVNNRTETVATVLATCPWLVNAM
jgi:hypothetical protein